jgi:hemoglobin
MSIFETIGGESSIAEAVEIFYEKLRTDEVIGVFFENRDVSTLRTQQTMFLTAALGGPDAYQGRDMRAAHAHLAITDADFDLFLQHLAETFTELGAPPAPIAEIVGALEPLRTEIVSAPGEGPDRWGSLDPSGAGD